MRTMKILDLIKKHKTITGAMGIFVFIFSPIGLNYLCWKQGWNAEMAVGYYGTMLGALATMITLIVTINYSRRQGEKSFKESQILESKQRVLDICNELITLCEPNYVFTILNNIQFDAKDDTATKASKRATKILLLSNQIESVSKKLYFFKIDEDLLKEKQIIPYIDDCCETIRYFAACEIEELTRQDGNQIRQEGVKKLEKLNNDYKNFVLSISELPSIVVAMEYN